MSLFILASAMSARACAPHRPADAALKLFDPACRAAVARFAARDPGFGDLALSFPALLHRLAIRGEEPGCRVASDVVLRGGSLKEAAAYAGVPWWTRRLPPEAFGARPADLPDGEWFRHRIANCLPRSRRDASRWLAVLTSAVSWGEPDVVLWLARECARDPKEVRPEFAPLLCLFAWYSKRPDVLGGSLGDLRFTHVLRFREALERARTWLSSAALSMELGARSFDPWLEPREIDGFEFTPLVTRAEVLAEARAMRNCLRDYGGEIAQDYERIWSVRREGRRVATLSVSFANGAPFPQLDQLNGRENANVAPEIWFAARSWINAQTPERPKTKSWEEVALDRAAWVEMWKPYWVARGRVPAGLPLRPSREALTSLYAWPPRRRRRLARHRRRA